MASLTREKILSVKDLPTLDVPVPEWADGDPEAYVRLRTLTGSEREQFESSVYSFDTDEEKPKVEVNRTNYRAKLCAFCIVGDDAVRLFAEEDIPALAGKSSLALDRVFQAAQKLNGLGAAAVKAATKN